jgi:hypothetical protein
LNKESTLEEMKDWNDKQVLLWRVACSGRERINGEGEEGGIRSIYFLYLCENRTLTLVEIILNSGAVRENYREDESIQTTFLTQGNVTRKKPSSTSKIC